MVEQLKWKRDNSGIPEEQVKVEHDGLYFLYLQVTLASQMKGNYTITVQSINQTSEVILKGLINGSKLSTVFMGKGVILGKGEVLNVTCIPEAKIKIHHTETYLGVIKLHEL